MAGKACHGYISETIRCRKLILGGDIGWGCRSATSSCDLDLTFDLAVVTLNLKLLSRLYLRIHKVQDIGGVGEKFKQFKTSVGCSR